MLLCYEENMLPVRGILDSSEVKGLFCMMSPHFVRSRVFECCNVGHVLAGGF